MHAYICPVFVCVCVYCTHVGYARARAHTHTHTHTHVACIWQVRLKGKAVPCIDLSIHPSIFVSVSVWVVSVLSCVCVSVCLCVCVSVCVCVCVVLCCVYVGTIQGEGGPEGGSRYGSHGVARQEHALGKCAV